MQYTSFFIHVSQITGTVVTPYHIHVALSMTYRETGLFPHANNGYEQLVGGYIY